MLVWETILVRQYIEILLLSTSWLIYQIIVLTSLVSSTAKCASLLAAIYAILLLKQLKLQILIVLKMLPLTPK